MTSIISSASSGIGKGDMQYIINPICVYYCAFPLITIYAIYLVLKRGTSLVNILMFFVVGTIVMIGMMINSYIMSMFCDYIYKKGA